LFLTDFVAVKTIKETIMRLRPTHNPRLEGLVLMVQDELGNYYRGVSTDFFQTTRVISWALLFFSVCS
ncbi:MAG: hypothetical protein ACKO7B_13200, partial [Flavobacteriales bacterium]